jgi:hypothetical protein
MAITKIGAVLGTAALLLAFTGTAVAKPLPPPVVVAHSLVEATPQMFIDSTGTENMVWGSLSKQTDSFGDHYSAVAYARKAKGAKHFTQVKLTGIFDPQNPLIYQVSPGVLQILVNGFASSAAGASEGAFAWRSANDGKTWTVIDGTDLSSATLHGENIYINEQAMIAAPGGPIVYAGPDGVTGPIVQIKNDLSGYTTIAPLKVDILKNLLARSSAGTVFILGAGSTDASMTYQAGNNTGQMTVPSCAAGVVDVTKLAAGRSVAVVAMSGCGHTWARTISPSGTLGKLVNLGPATTSEPGVSVVAASDGHFTVAWTVPGGDLGVSHSSNGSKWTASRGAVPIATYGTGGTISTGVATWYSFGTGSDRTYQVANRVRALPLSETYRTPKPPSAHGIRAPRRAHFGSLAVTVPGKIAMKHFRKTGKVTIRLVDALTTRIPVSVSVTRTRGDTTYDIGSGGLTPKLTAGRAKTITLTCGSGAIVIGGTAAPGIDTHKGDLVVFSFGGRNPGLTVNARVA